MHLKTIEIENVAGYRRLRWPGLQPGLNLLMGRNGAGKSTVLQTIVMSLTYIAEQAHNEDLLAATYPDGSASLTLSDSPQPRRLSFEEILVSQGAARRPEFGVLAFVENRQPQNRIGRNASHELQNSASRYPRTLGGLQALLRSKEESDRALADEAFALAARLQPELGSEWSWIKDQVASRGPKRARPVSCGQFDYLSIMLDIARIKHRDPSLRKPVLVVLDNPDIYLHPDLQVRLLDLLQTELGNPQVIVATHSLKLLSGADPKGTFWIDRQAAISGEIEVRSIRNLQAGARNLFFDLYGTDTTSAVASLVRELESPAYFQFLRECALPAQAEIRQRPDTDPQLGMAAALLHEKTPSPTVLDFGAGHGDLLEAICRSTGSRDPVTYIALDRQPSSFLLGKLEHARNTGAIKETSRAVTSLDSVPDSVDIVFCLNVCHELRLPDLARVLAELLGRLRGDGPSRLVIVEVDTLIKGETDFIMWRPEDYQELFRGEEGLTVEVRRPERNSGMPVSATVVTASRSPRQVTPDKLELKLRAILPSKKNWCLDRIEQLQSDTSPELPGYALFMRHRELAFCVAQVAMISLEERRAS